MPRAQDGHPISAIVGGVVIHVLASAGASVSKVRGVHGGALKVAVRAAPEKGRANAEIEAVLAEFFNVAHNQVAIVGGQTARQKRVQISGITQEAAVARINTIG